MHNFNLAYSSSERRPKVKKPTNKRKNNFGNLTVLLQVKNIAYKKNETINKGKRNRHKSLKNNMQATMLTKG